MLKEWLGNRAIDAFGLYLKAKHRQHVTPESDQSFEEIRRKIKSGDKIPYLQSIELLHGHETVVKGKENLQAIKGRFIIIANILLMLPLGLIQ